MSHSALGSFSDVISQDALDFVASLDREFFARRRELLRRRRELTEEFLFRKRAQFPLGNCAIRENAGWRVPIAPTDLLDRRVEIASSAENPKVVINALNSGAQTWIADLEDATSPTWNNILASQRNLRKAVHGTIAHDSPDGKRYRLEGGSPAIVVRPRAWHLPEFNFRVDGRPASASVVDFGLYFFHCAQALLDHGSGPYFYLPKLTGSIDALLWNDVFEFAQDAFGLPTGTIRATALIEDVGAAHEMPEILHFLGAHALGLAAGRWDYLFSFHRYFRLRPEFVMPDRACLTMTVPFMRNFSELLIETCHTRGAYAIGGVATHLPDKHDPVANNRALAAVRLDKEREAEEGFDGTWVVHPNLVSVCRSAFDRVLQHRPHQIDRIGRKDPIDSAGLLALDGVEGQVTLSGLRSNIAISLRYLRAWLRGQGSVGLYGLMEGLATVEIARALVWQWLYHRVPLLEGGAVTEELVRALIEEETAGDHEFDAARELFEKVALAPEFPDYLTLPGYEQLVGGRRDVKH